VIIRRPYSVPERLTMFYSSALAAGVIYPTIMTYTHGQGIPCPLLKLTGIPCPFCGLTTATVALSHGQWAAAAYASPLACIVAMLTVGTVPVLATRALGKVQPPRPVSERTRGRITRGACVVVGMSWIYQLHRFGVI
jgi:hypothetical protein